MERTESDDVERWSVAAKVWCGAEGIRATRACERAAAAGVIAAGQRRRSSDADRVRESFEPVTGARHDSAEGDRDSRGAGSGKGAVDGADADGELIAIEYRRFGW